MNSQSNSRPSDPGDGAYGAPVGHPRPSYDSNFQSRYQGYSNGYPTTDTQNQRRLGADLRDDRNQNGYSPPSPIDGRNGRPKDMNQNLPVRERSRTNGPANAPPGVNKSANGTRICKKCGESLTGQFVRALGGTYHLECFLCQVRVI